MRRTIVLTLVMLALGAANAMALSKGSCMVVLGLGNASADLTLPAGTGYITSFQTPEVHVQGQFMYLLADDYAFDIGGAYGFFNETDKPGSLATPGSPELTTKITSFAVRVGGDRVVNLGSRAAIYFGPGIEFWNGKYKYEAGSVTDESASTNRISLSGRMGGIMWISDRVGLTGHVAHKLGQASAEKDGAKTTWWPTSMEGAGGLVLAFGK